MRYLILITIALTFVCLPLFAQETGSSEEAGSGAAASQTFSCEGRTVGTGEETGWEEGAVGEGDVGYEAADEEAYLEDQALYEESQQAEQQPEEEGGYAELPCEETPNPDGTYTCYDESGSPLSCVEEAGELVCYP